MKYLISLIICLLSSGVVFAADKPNILWITSEDNSISWVSCYGAANCQTPNIDKLADEGFRYLHCFDNAAVCAPTRSTWITGLYAISMGTQPMRSRYNIPHDKIPYYPDQLKKAGYHISNGNKTDYNIGGRRDGDCWKGFGSGWERRKPGQPFFVIKNIKDSHESRAFPKKSNEITVDPKEMKLHPYHPDLPGVRETYARYTSSVQRMDKEVGEILAKLQADGLADDTIVVYCSDHGGVLPRSKRFVYSSGTHCPLIVRIPKKWKHWWPAEKPGMTVDRMVAFVDMPKTWLSLCGAGIPETYQGTIFLGDGIEPEPKYNLSFRERADECADNVRSMRDKRCLYIKNYMPWAPNGQQLSYMWTMSATRAWHQHYLDGKCNEVTGRFFRERVSEEFYDTAEDFHNIDNLIDEPRHQEKIKALRAAMRAKQLELRDSGLLPEAMRVRRAKANNMTIYDMVRDEKLYPLEDYLDAADLALERNPKHREQFEAQLSHTDEGMRYWAVCGLFLLGNDAGLSKPALIKALDDGAGEVSLMAAWALERVGETEKSGAYFAKLNPKRAADKNMAASVLKWRAAKHPKR